MQKPVDPEKIALSQMLTEAMNREAWLRTRVLVLEEELKNRDAPREAVP
jgi:hypothetical protein